MRADSDGEALSWPHARELSATHPRAAAQRLAGIPVPPRAGRADPDGVLHRVAACPRLHRGASPRAHRGGEGARSVRAVRVSADAPGRRLVVAVPHRAGRDRRRLLAAVEDLRHPAASPHRAAHHRTHLAVVELPHAPRLEARGGSWCHVRRLHRPGARPADACRPADRRRHGRADRAGRGRYPRDRRLAAAQPVRHRLLADLCGHRRHPEQGHGDARRALRPDPRRRRRCRDVGRQLLHRPHPHPVHRLLLPLRRPQDLLLVHWDAPAPRPRPR